MNAGYGFGKTILFGEHFVVYGLPAIVGALSCKTQVSIQLSDDDQIHIIDNRLNSTSVFAQVCTLMVKEILKFFKIEQKIKLSISGNLPTCSGGIGGSASFCAATARALNNFFNLNLNDEQINQAAFCGEKVAHGNPSGIDNTAAVYGGLFWFEKRENGASNKIENLKLKDKIEIVLVDSGIFSSTKTVVDDVKIFKQNHPNEFKKISEQYLTIVKEAKKALLDFDLKRLGRLMNANHDLLKKIDVSCDKLNLIVEMALKNGAFGAKLTGKGQGGFVLCLTPGVELQEKIARFFEGQGFFVIKAEI